MHVVRAIANAAMMSLFASPPHNKLRGRDALRHTDGRAESIEGVPFDLLI
jgi:hypothetical protein